jgi:hypothetical protein
VPVGDAGDALERAPEIRWAPVATRAERSSVTQSRSL